MRDKALGIHTKQPPDPEHPTATSSYGGPAAPSRRLWRPAVTVRPPGDAVLTIGGCGTHLGASAQLRCTARTPIA